MTTMMSLMRIRKKSDDLKIITRKIPVTEAKEKYGSAFAFHGSHIGNWHSIVRKGLINASGTDLMSNGAICGKGIYLSTESDICAAYSSLMERKQNLTQKRSEDSRFVHYDSNNLYCLALCEVVQSPALRKLEQDRMWIVSDADHVAVRFLFLWEKGIQAQGVNTQHRHVNQLILKAMNQREED